MDKIKALWAKYREIISYIFFGGLTTVVSWGVYFLCINILSIHYQAAQWISWGAAVTFAFVVNKLFVFADKEKSTLGLTRQIFEFVSMRIASGVVEDILLTVLVEMVGVGEGLSKIIVSVLTVIVNYVASKLLIFRKNRKHSAEKE